MALQTNKILEQLRERLKHRYRMVIMNDETFEEVGSYRLTWLNVYMALSVFLVVVVGMVVLIFVFTPVKQYLPGYGDVNQRDKLWQIEKRLRTLEDEVNARQVYINSVRDALTANVEYEPTNIKAEKEEIPETFLDVEPIEEDYAIRGEVARQGFPNAGGTGQAVAVNQLGIEQILFVAPLKGTVSEGFRPHKKHFGVDIIAPRNTPIKAVADGVVISSDWTYDTGNVIGVQHDGNIISFYKHNSVLLKKVGSFVKAGEAVAIIGNTGELTDGPHLHFELWHQGNPIDPTKYINFN